MIKTVKVSLTILIACIFSVSMALAADQEKKRDRDPDQKKDSSCQSFLMNQDAAFDMAANQNRKGNRRGGGNGDRKRDGSCMG